MNLTVIGPRVFVRPDALPETTGDGLLHLVHDRQKSTMYGTVVAVGDGCEYLKRAVGAALDEVKDRIENKYVRATVEEVRDRFVPEHAVEVGERVVFSPDHGQELIFEKDLLVVLMEDDILAVIE